MKKKQERKTRSDCTVGTYEKKKGLEPGTVRNVDGSNARSDKKLGTLRNEIKKDEEKK